LDGKGKIFGGFIPVKWESGYFLAEADDSLKTFVFTLKNRHTFPGRRFGLKAARKHDAIICDSGSGPWFNGAILVCDNCNSRAENSGHIGDCYTDDTLPDERTVFTRARQFQVQEIEVFAITN
jgi:hypothetical protein